MGNFITLLAKINMIFITLGKYTRLRAYHYCYIQAKLHKEVLGKRSKNMECKYHRTHNQSDHIYNITISDLLAARSCMKNITKKLLINS